MDERGHGTVWQYPDRCAYRSTHDYISYGNAARRISWNPRHCRGCAGGGEQGSAQGEADTFFEYRKTAVPQFVSTMEYEIRKETKIPLEDLCKALDGNGNEIPVWMVGLYKQNGEPCTWSEQDMESYVQFPGSGIYYIQVRAMDAMGREQCAVITVPVQE